jgi:hypothetical protein
MNALLENQAAYRDLASTAFSVRRPVLDQHHLECRRSRAVDLRDRATVHITRTLATKGLEFDFVVLAEPRATERRVGGARAARTTYIGITRAVQQLLVTCSDELPDTLRPGANHFAMTRA